jgi:hypothetical protein
MDRLQRLTDVFRKLGASDPEQWAKSEIREDIPELARFLFLRGAWRSVVPDGDTDWIEAKRQPSRDPAAPLAGIAPALERLLAKGIDPNDLTDVVRVMQYGVLFDLCYLLDDPYPAFEGIEGLKDLAPELERIGWGLFEVDDEDEEGVGRQISGLHESVLETDPSGREMRPRKR